MWIFFSKFTPFFIFLHAYLTCRCYNLIDKIIQNFGGGAIPNFSLREKNHSVFYEPSVVCREWLKDGKRKRQKHYTVSLGLHRLPKASKRSPKSLRYDEPKNRSLPGPMSNQQGTSKRFKKTRWTLDFGETNWVFKGTKSQCETSVLTAHLKLTSPA